MGRERGLLHTENGRDRELYVCITRTKLQTELLRKIYIISNVLSGCSQSHIHTHTKHDLYKDLLRLLTNRGHEEHERYSRMDSFVFCTRKSSRFTTLLTAPIKAQKKYKTSHYYCLYVSASVPLSLPRSIVVVFLHPLKRNKDNYYRKND
jgi:hypothetical protein